MEPGDIAIVCCFNERFWNPRTWFRWSGTHIYTCIRTRDTFLALNRYVNQSVPLRYTDLKSSAGLGVIYKVILIKHSEGTAM